MFHEWVGAYKYTNAEAHKFNNTKKGGTYANSQRR
jgi:hypothetical protein